MRLSIVVKLWCVAACLVTSSCKKQHVPVLAQAIQTTFNYDLNDIAFVNDSVGFTCGGSRYEIGIFAKTTNGGLSWQAADSIIPKAAYSLSFLNEQNGWVGGYDSYVAKTIDGGQSFTVQTGNYFPTYDLFFADSLRGLSLSGNGGVRGFVQRTQDGGATWTETELLSTLRGAAYAGNYTWYVCGYGVVYKSTDDGRSFTPTPATGDNFMAIDFPTATTGYVIGYDGTILKTDDGGETFKKQKRGNAFFAPREHLLAINFLNENVGYVCGEGGLMYTTKNGGESWEKIQQFTTLSLRGIHLFSPIQGAIAADNGKAFLFKTE